MKSLVIQAALGAAALLGVSAPVAWWVTSAEARLEESRAVAADPTLEVATASAADVGYCTPELKKILRRVLTSCGLMQTGELRGCQPLEAKSVATLAGDDFNALFLPLADRAGILQYDVAKSELDGGDTELLDRLFADQRGASYFFVVARSSPEGDELYNRKLSEARGQAVLAHLRETFDDPDLDKEVGLLWLGEEFAQLDEQFCDWTRSGDPDQCTAQELNRSAFVAWIDCRL